MKKLFALLVALAVLVGSLMGTQNAYSDESDGPRCFSVDSMVLVGPDERPGKNLRIFEFDESKKPFALGLSFWEDGAKIKCQLTLRSATKNEDGIYEFEAAAWDGQKFVSTGKGTDEKPADIRDIAEKQLQKTLNPKEVTEIVTAWAKDLGSISLFDAAMYMKVFTTALLEMPDEKIAEVIADAVESDFRMSFFAKQIGARRFVKYWWEIADYYEKEVASVK